MAVKPLFAEVILPLAVDGSFTYAVPDSLAGQVKKGARVLVQFGKKKIYSAVVRDLTHQPPGGFKPKFILSVLDELPIINDYQFRLWDWMVSYYMCTPGEVMKAALPSGLRLESESTVRIKRGYDRVHDLSYPELLLYEIIKDHESLSVKAIEAVELEENPLKVLKGLLEKGAVQTDESVRESYKPRTVTHIGFTAEYADEQKLSRVLDGLDRAPKQRALIEMLVWELEEAFKTISYGSTIQRKVLIDRGAGSSALTALLQKGIIESTERKEPAGPATGEETRPYAVTLTLEQGEVLNSIREQFKNYQTVLLQGVTSSGKTELYFRLISETLKAGRQVLYLLPEIALTAQMVERLKEAFGSMVEVYHSRFSDSDRTGIYRDLLNDPGKESCRIILGARSALFLPFRNLGLIIVDEEHENSYKQSDPAPRYHARDTANVLALFHNARVLLGSATPSFESFYNARREKFGFAKLTTRFGDVELPEVIIADSREAGRKKKMVSHFTPELMQAMKEALDRREQIMLFQNRRGYTNYLVCSNCGHIPRCRHCDVSLTYHKSSGKLECHYCGAREPVPSVCGQCHQGALVMKGFGTEKIEDELKILFEGVRIGRLDTDSARTRKGYEKIVHDFATGKMDILVGTQLISKGFDFENVSLVGVLDADGMLNFPDFRSFERSFQLISQVSGRAGRRKKRGKVIIQTTDPGHPVIRYLVKNDYEGLFNDQMEERRLFHYPPWTRMIRLLFRHRVPSILDGGAGLVARELKEVFGVRVLGPHAPPVLRIQDHYQKQLFIKIEREASFEKAKSIILEKMKLLEGNPVYRSIRINADVDPM
ncbi:MAG: primosomal protein N' [Bacteroidales bacterium]|nr:primosomal protein N' [Bacteroidales bacterium]